MIAAAPLFNPLPSRRLGEQRVLLTDVSWEIYVSLRDAVGTPGVRMTYSEGSLEIMSSLPEHEDTKKTIARLIEMYAIERDVPLYGYGSTTFRSKAQAHGLEPDECYCVGRRLKDVPDIAVEVVLTSGGLEKLPVYKRLGVREVWFWEQDAFHLHALRPRGYEALRASEVLPGLDMDAVAGFVRRSDQHEAVKAFRSCLRAVQ